MTEGSVMSRYAKTPVMIVAGTSPPINIDLPGIDPGMTLQRE